MSRLDELRQKASKQRAEREKAYAQNVQEAVKTALSSDSLVMMTALANGGKAVLENQEATNQVVAHIAQSVTKTITNPVDNFLSITRIRGFTKRRLKVAVTKIYEMYFSEFNKDDSISTLDVPYEEQLEAVATKLELEPGLWDTISFLKSEEEL